MKHYFTKNDAEYEIKFNQPPKVPKIWQKIYIQQKLSALEKENFKIKKNTCFSMSYLLINAANLTFLSKKETMFIEEPRARAVTTPASTHLKVKKI